MRHTALIIYSDSHVVKVGLGENRFMYTIFIGNSDNVNVVFDSFVPFSTFWMFSSCYRVPAIQVMSLTRSRIRQRVDVI